MCDYMRKARTSSSILKKAESTPVSKKKKTMTACIPGPRIQIEQRAHFVVFFSKYPTFGYDPSKPYLEELNFLTKQNVWNEDMRDY